MRTRLMCLALACFTPAALVHAQSPAAIPAMPRADASFSVGWLNSDSSSLTDGMDNWASNRATLAGQGGVYWTEHWKTELMAERSSRQNVWAPENLFLPSGRIAWRNSEHAIQDTRVSIGQFYQFGHNAWVHASLGGGVAVTWRDIHTTVSPLHAFDGRTDVILEPGETRDSDDVRTNAFAAAIVKAYMSPRLFVRTDAQMDFRGSLDAVVFRIGFGVDF